MLFRLVQAGLVALHVGKMWTWFRAIDWSHPSPLLNVDYAQYYGRVLRMHHFLGESGRIWGYDPFDMAGYLSGPFLEVGTHLLAIMAHVLAPLIGVERALLFLETGGLALAPFLVIVAVRAAGGSPYQAWSAFAFVLPVYGFIDPFSATMARVGLWGFMMAGFVAPLQVALVWRWLTTGGFAAGALVTAVTAILFGLHPASLVVVALPNALIFALMARQAGWRRCLMSLVLAGVVLAANWYWIRPFVAFSDWKSDAPYFVTGGFLDMWRLVSPAASDVFHAVRIIDLGYLLALGVIGSMALFRRDRRLGTVLGGWLGWLFLVGFFGSALPVLDGLQPGRNLFPLWILCCVIAGAMTPTVLLARRARRWFAGGLLALSCVLMFSEASRAAWFFPRLSNRLPSGQEKALSYLRESSVAGRVMLECVDSAAPHIADLATWRTGKVLFGGQHPGNFLITRFGLFSGVYNAPAGLELEKPIAFGRPVASFGDESFAQYLSAYNIDMVVVRTDQMRNALAPLSGLFEEPVVVGGYSFHRVRAGAPGWLMEGTGKVTFAYDRIRIEQASPGRIVLKAHWIRTFRTEPPAPIFPTFLLDDPVPVVAIDNSAGHKDILIYNAGL